MTSPAEGLTRDQALRRFRTLETDTNLAMVHFRMGHAGAQEALDGFHAETIRIRGLHPDITLADVHGLTPRKEVVP